MNRTAVLMAGMVLLLSACEKPSQSNYNASELGVSRSVDFGTIIDVKEINIIPDKKDANSTDVLPGGAGTWVGGAAGLGAGSMIGNGSGNLWSDVGGAVIGAVAGRAIEQNLRSTTGYQYVLSMQSGETKTIALGKVDGEVVLKPGDKVMLQYCDTGGHEKRCKGEGQYQRLIKVDKFPPRPHDAKKHYSHHDDDDDDDYDDKNK